MNDPSAPAPPPAPPSPPASPPPASSPPGPPPPPWRRFTAPPIPSPRVLHGKLKEEITYGARVIVHAHLAPPATASRLRRFLWGFALPFGILRAVLRDPAMRKRWLEVTGAQIVVVLAMTFFAFRFAYDEEHHLGEILATVYSIVCAVEWIVIAFSRQYHDELSLIASYATRVPGDPLKGAPRVHVDFPWLWKKLKRRVRGFLLIASGAPLFALLLLIPVAGHALYAVMTTLWVFYWVSVFAIGATAFAWTPDPPSRAPWFLRGFDAAAQLPVVGLPFRFYAWLWHKVTRSVHAPCETHAVAVYEGAGLALARAITGIPGVYLFVRPVFPVAATHVVLARMPPRPPAMPPPFAPPSSAPPPWSPPAPPPPFVPPTRP